MKRILSILALVAMSACICRAFAQQPPTLDPLSSSTQCLSANIQCVVCNPATAIAHQYVNFAPLQVSVPIVEFLAIQTPDSTDLRIPVIRCASHVFPPVDTGSHPAHVHRQRVPHSCAVPSIY